MLADGVHATHTKSRWVWLIVLGLFGRISVVLGGSGSQGRIPGGPGLVPGLKDASRVVLDSFRDSRTPTGWFWMHPGSGTRPGMPIGCEKRFSMRPGPRMRPGRVSGSTPSPGEVQELVLDRVQNLVPERFKN
jgi:hypothetical protein